MDVDHFDPTIKDRYLQPYKNLFLACRHCNGKKSAFWPTPEMIAHGIRFLDCTQEADYGEHILEDPISHKVFGTTPAGKYHVRILDLNADVLVKHRSMRANLRLFLTKTPLIMKPKAFDQLLPVLALNTELLRLMIPDIPCRTPPTVS